MACFLIDDASQGGQSRLPAEIVGAEGEGAQEGALTELIEAEVQSQGAQALQQRSLQGGAGVFGVDDGLSECGGGLQGQGGAVDPAVGAVGDAGQRGVVGVSGQGGDDELGQKLQALLGGGLGVEASALLEGEQRVFVALLLKIEPDAQEAAVEKFAQLF